MDWINQLLQQYSDMTKANPLVATLVMPLIAGLMFYLKDVPKKFWDLLVRYSTVTMRLNNAGYDGNIDAYNMFDKWFMQSGHANFSRSFFMFRQYKDDMFMDERVYNPYRLGIGRGLHVFWYRGKFFWFEKGTLESGGSEKQKEEITIRTFGWSQTAFVKLVELFNEKKGPQDEVLIHKFNGEKNWEQVGRIPMRDIATFCMNEDQKREILEKITEFTNRRDWYRKKGLTYKTSFLFYGPPGTGKTTLAKLLAAHFKKDVYLIDLSQHSNNSLVEALASIKPGSIVLLEDVDQAGSAVKDREKKKDLADVIGESMSYLTMSGMLNAFDGVVGLDDLIIIMTTNKPDDIDSAVRRKSRIDNEYLIDNLTSKEIWKYMVQMYELDIEMQQIWAVPFMAYDIQLPGCEVENAFKEHPENPRAFMDEIAKRSSRRLKLVA